MSLRGSGTRLGWTVILAGLLYRYARSTATGSEQALAAECIGLASYHVNRLTDIDGKWRRRG